MSSAQDVSVLPNGVIRFVVNSQPGGTVDVTTRVLAEELAPLWNHSTIVENVVGAGGNLGAAQVARAEPDGATLLVSHAGPLTINPLLFKSMAYEPVKLVPVTIAVSFPNLLVVGPSLRVRTVDQLISEGSKRKLTYGSQGVGTSTHLAASLFASRAGIDLLHVPYRGSPAALLDLAGGRIDMMFDNIGTAFAQHTAGTTRILAVADGKRLSSIPDVPTMEEAGLPNFRSIAWFAVVAPPGIHPALAQRISRDIKEVLGRPRVAERLDTLNLQTVANTPEEAAAFIRDETALWGAVIREAKIAPQ